MWYIHIAVSTQLLLGKNCILFYWSGLTSIWPIAYWQLSMPLLVVRWCLSQLMRYCFISSWTCTLDLEDHPLVWRCRLFDSSMLSVLPALILSPMPSSACSRLCSRVGCKRVIHSKLIFSLSLNFCLFLSGKHHSCHWMDTKWYQLH